MTQLTESEIAAAKAYPLANLVARDAPLRRAGGLLMARCPFHNEKSPSFTIYPDGHAYCFGCTKYVKNAVHYLELTRRIGFAEAVKELCGGAPMTPRGREGATATPPSRGAPSRNLQRYIDELWRTADAPKLAELYLESRGIKVRPRPLPEALRGHKRVWCTETREYRPALLAALGTLPGHVCALQRIWVEPKLVVEGGKTPEKGTRADLKSPKKTIGRMGSGAVCLYPPGPFLGIAEGVESAMSAAELFCLPVWATCGASRLGSVALPEGTKGIVVFGDNGPAGEAAAAKAVSEYRRRGYDAESQFPPPQYDDFNTMMRAR